MFRTVSAGQGLDPHTVPAELLLFLIDTIFLVRKNLGTGTAFSIFQVNS